jgi:hypothetical protein
MPIDSVCEGCGRTLRVADEYAGMDAQCPACMRIFRVPGDPVASSQVSPLQTPTLDAAKAEPYEAASNRSALQIEVGTPPPLQSAPNANSLGNPQVGAVRFFVMTPSGVEYGPADIETILRWQREGRVNATCLVRQENTAYRMPFEQWRAANSIPSAPQVSPAPSASNPYGASPLGNGTQSFGAIPGAMPSTVSYPREPRGILVVVLAALSWVLCFTFIGAIPCAAIALYLGMADLASIRRGEMAPQDRGLLLTGVWLAGINLVLTVVFVCLWIVAFISGSL